MTLFIASEVGVFFCADELVRLLKEAPKRASTLARRAGDLLHSRSRSVGGVFAVA